MGGTRFPRSKLPTVPLLNPIRVARSAIDQPNNFRAARTSSGPKHAPAGSCAFFHRYPLPLRERAPDRSTRPRSARRESDRVRCERGDMNGRSTPSRSKISVDPIACSEWEGKVAKISF